MKKVILSFAIIAGIIATTNVQAVQAGERPVVNTVFEDDGFVDARLEDLNEQVQQAINALSDEYDVQALKYNAEKQLTKVKLTKRDDQSSKTIFFDAQGKEVEKDRDQATEQESVEHQQQPPTSELSGVMQDNGFQNAKFEDLNEKVQEAVREFANDYDITVLQYDNNRKIAKITGRSKEDQSEKTIHLNDEAQEVNLDAEQTEQTRETQETQEMQERQEQTQEPPLW